MSARSYATIQCSIWQDADFVALSPSAQATYFMLVTQSDLTACGSLALTVRRWSRYVAGGDARLLATFLNELSAARFIVIDKDTEELLVRTFVRYDNGYRHATRVKAVVANAEALVSATLRYVISVELDLLGVAHHVEVMSGSGENPRNHGPRPVDNPSGSGTPRTENRLSSGTPEPVESPRSVVTLSGERSTPHSTLHKGGGVALTSDPELPPHAPPGHCAKHPGGTDQPCGPCKHARGLREAWDAEQAAATAAAALARRDAARTARRDAITACHLCDDRGYRHLDDGTTGAVCNHAPLNTGGRARALAALNHPEPPDDQDGETHA